jgi:hypothetical protein
MIRVRRVEDVAIVDWTHKDVATLVPRLRALVESREASRALLNMAEVETLKGEGLETLIEALHVCEEGGCVLGMFALCTYVSKLIDIMDLRAVMPASLGANEGEAVVRLRTLKPSRERSIPAKVGSGSAQSGREGGVTVAQVEIEFEPQEPVKAAPAAPRAPTRSAAGDLELDIEMPTPAAKTRPAAASPASSPPLAVTLKFDKSIVGAVHDSADDMLAISWADLAAQGIQIGGPGGRELSAKANADAGMIGAPGAPAISDGTRPTAKFPTKSASGELEIDIEEAPAPLKPRAFKTEVITTFELDSADAEEELAKSPATPAFRADETRGDDDTSELEVDFEPVRVEEVGFGPDVIGLPVTQALFGESAPDETGWSPLDAPSSPPAKPSPVETVSERAPTPPRPLPARPVPTPPTASPQTRTPTAPLPAQQPTPPSRPGARPPASAPAPVTHKGQAAPPSPAAPAPGYLAADGGDETVMFQPDGLLAEVLAAVTPTPAAPEGPADTSLDVSVRPRADDTALDLQAAAPAPATPAPAAASTHDDLRKFLVDYAIVSELHLRVLERFSREGTEKVLGRPEVQAAVGGSAAGVASIIEDFVQARLLKRRRSPRVRGGTGFLYSPSPKTRNTVKRLLRLYEESETRAQVLSWVQAARQAAGA